MTKAYINAFSTGHTKSANFAVLVEGDHNDKEYSYEVDDTTMNAAEVQAARFVLEGVYDKGSEVKIYTSNRYLTSMLEKREDGEWTKAAIANRELVEGVRSLSDTFTNLDIVLDKTSKRMKRVRELARK